MKDFKSVMQALRIGRCDKVVLARKVRLQLYADNLDMFRVFSAACHVYPHNYVAMWHTPQTGTWLTATPELILSRTADNLCHTMALAGTMSANNPSASKIEGWSEKNVEEQRLVQQHISHVLTDLGIQYNSSSLRIVPSGDLLHLRTDYQFPSPEDVTSLLNKLHPTPAVLGMPTDAAREVLENAEHLEREYYAGFSGPLSADGSFSLYVTLRCMHKVDKGCDLYAGSGLLPQSDAEEEWQETERKLDALRKLIPLSS